MGEGQELFVERIGRDEAYWKKHAPIAKQFFEEVVLPNLISPEPTAPRTPLSPVKTNNAQQQPSTEKTNTQDVWCSCGGPESGDMVGCDNANCPHVWFHFSCVGLKSAPKGQWFCPVCCQLPEFSKKESRDPRKK
jgi:inhibitor of growth protein 3